MGRKSAFQAPPARHVATFALTWRHYCLWKAGFAESTFASKRCDYMAGRQRSVRLPRTCVIAAIFALHETQRGCTPWPARRAVCTGAVG